MCSNDLGPDANDIKHRDRSSSAPVNGSLESKKDDDKKEVRTTCSAPVGQAARRICQGVCTRFLFFVGCGRRTAQMSAAPGVRQRRLACTHRRLTSQGAGREMRKARVETVGMVSGARMVARKKALQRGTRRVPRRVQVRLALRLLALAWWACVHACASMRRPLLGVYAQASVWTCQLTTRPNPPRRETVTRARVRRMWAAPRRRQRRLAMLRQSRTAKVRQVTQICAPSRVRWLGFPATFISHPTCCAARLSSWVVVQHV